MCVSTPTIHDPDDLPALYRSTNQQSIDSQKSFLLWLKIRLGGFVVAAVGGAVGWRLGGLHLGGAVAFVAFAVALAAELVLAIQRPDRIWYEGRAAAESAKTLSWRYMVRAESFETNVADVDQRFVHEIDEVLHDLDAISAPTTSSGDLQITPTMRAVRSRSFDERRDIYLRERIQDQHDWYERKAAWNDTRAKRLTATSVLLEFLGLIGAAVKAVGWLDIDLLGILAAAASAATAWLQAKQHQTLATAYWVTSQELATVASEVTTLTDEGAWPQFVAKAEAAISREHTLWRASRGVRARSRKP